MPRRPRNILQDEYYHIISRGNNRKSLFYSESDYRYFFNTLQKYKIKFDVNIFHYCLMTNHIHLLLRCPSSSNGITKMMHGVKTTYAKHFSQIHETTGAIFENRFKSFYIDSDAYLLECGRYIEKNPVRAGMVRNAHDYFWSSYRHYGIEQKDPIITINPLYKTLGNSWDERKENYKTYVNTPRAYEEIVDRFFDERVLS